MKRKIAFVVQRYGKEVNGGAEYLCRTLAEHMASCYDVEVLTSCSLSYPVWDNYYNAGTEEINRIKVHRFPVRKIKDIVKYEELKQKMREGSLPDEQEWIDEKGPFCPDYVDFLQNNASSYEAVIFITYSHYLTIMGLKLGLKNAVLLPTAHNEPEIYLSVYREIFQLPKAFLYNTKEEKELMFEKFPVKTKPYVLGCTGIEIPEANELELPDYLKKYGNNYIVYTGRISNSKNFKELNRFFIEYKKRNPSGLKLVAAGRTDEGMELIYSEDIIYAGFVPENEKNAIIKNARLLVMPSKYESLSLVLLESMAFKRPVLVNEECSVLKGQCIRSNAGLYYKNYFEFELALNYMLTHHKEYEQMGKNGYGFVKENYQWERVVERIDNLIQGLGGQNG